MLVLPQHNATQNRTHMSDSFLVAVLVAVSIIISIYQFITIVL